MPSEAGFSFQGMTSVNFQAQKVIYIYMKSQLDKYFFKILSGFPFNLFARKSGT